MPSPNQRPWRIAHSESSLGWGGQEHRVLAELVGFKQRGCSVCLLAPPKAAIFQRARSATVPAVPLNVAKLLFPFNVLRLARWLQRERIEVLNPHSSRDGWLLGSAGRLARVPLIIRSRHIDVDYPNAWFSRHAFTTLADHVLTTSQKITAHFQDAFGLPDDRIATVPTGIDLTRFSPEGPRADLVPSARGLPLIGMVSVLRSWKGHTTFLEAARRMLETGFKARFVIVGDGPQRANLAAEVARLNLSAALEFMGHREDVPAVLRALDVLVIASTRHEGVPQIGLQALATKTPVVGSDVGGTPEIIRDGETGRNFRAGDAVGLAHAVRATLAEAEATRRMTDAGRTMVETRHSLGAMLDALEAIYRRHLPA
jgi:glycosyltransferase involved in cell wall biosynthesis